MCMLLKIIMKQLHVLMQDSFQSVTVKCCIYNNLTFKYFLHLMFSVHNRLSYSFKYFKVFFFDLKRGVTTSLLYTLGVREGLFTFRFQIWRDLLLSLSRTREENTRKSELEWEIQNKRDRLFSVFEGKCLVLGNCPSIKVPEKR